MSRMSLDTAIRLSAEVRGGGAIDRVKRSLQDFGKAGQTSKRDLDQLRAATFQLSRVNDQTIAGIKNSISAFRGLQEQARIGGREFKRYGEEIKRLETKLRGLDGAAAGAGESMAQKLAAGLGATGVGMALRGITMQAGRFDAELRRAAAIEGGAGSFEVLRKEIEKVASTAAGTPTQVAALATALSRAGFSAAETTAALAGIVRGAEATSITFEEMGSIAADNLRAFGLRADETGRVVDVLTQTANKSNQTVLDLGESMKYAAPIARSLGVPLEDLASVMALLANNGIRGSDAGTALRTGLTRLQIAAGGADSEIQDLTRGNMLLSRAMEVLNAEILDANGNLKPLDQVLIALRGNMQSLDSTNRAILAKALFGTEAGSKFQALLNSSEEQIRSMFGVVRDSGGVAAETQKKMMGFDFAVKVLGGNVETLTNQIGGMIGAALKPLIDGLNAAISASQGLPEPVRQIGAAAAAAGVSVGGLVLAIAGLKASLSIVGGLSAVTGSLTAAASAAKAMSAALLLNPWTAAAAGVVALTVAAYRMNEPFREFVDSYPERFSRFWRELGSDASSVIQRVTGLVKSIGDFSRSVLSGIRDTASSAIQFIIDRAGFLGPAIESVAGSMSSMFSGAFTIIQERWKETVANMINFSNPLLAIMKGIGIDVGGAFTSAMSTDAQRLTAAGSTATYTVGGITYDTATGRPVAPPPAFVPSMTVPAPSGAVPLSVIPAGGGRARGGGGRAGGSGAQREERMRLTDLARGAGFSPEQSRIMAAIALAESAGNPMAHNKKYPDNSYGLWQINMLGAMGPERRRQFGIQSNEQLFDPMVNARAAKSVFDSQGFGAWSVYKSGAYRQFLGQDPEVGGVDSSQIAQAQLQAADDLLQRQEAARESLEKFVEARIQGIAKQKEESELLRATTDVDRRRLEYAFEQTAIKERFRELEEEALRRQEEMNALGLEYNLQEQQTLINNEKQQALLNARVRFEQEINDLMVERTRMMQDLTNAASAPSAFNPLEQQKADLDALLQKYPAVGAAADQAADLATRGFADMVTGARSAKEVFADFLKGMADALIQNAKTMIAEYIAIGIARMFAGFGGGFGGGFNPNAAGPFGAGGLSTGLSFTPNFTGFANGGVMSPRGPMPLRTYSRGGVASSPQVAVFGEGMMNEAFVPLPDGRRIPVAMQMRDSGGRDRMRELMGPSPTGGGAPVLNMSFETGYDPINKVEYVTVEQLQASARETRKLAANDGAKRGMSMTLDRLQQSPSTRSRVGIAR